MSVTIPSLDPVTDILDNDKIMVTQSNGQTYTIDGASFNKRNQAVIANSTTLTGAPLKTGNIVRAYFTADITGVNTTTGLVLNYNGSNKNVKVPKDGALANFTAQNMGGSPTVYKYLQAYTTLELLYDGTNFVIIGNPVVISSADYTIYADGSKKHTSVYDSTYLMNLIQTEVRTMGNGDVYQFNLPSTQCAYLFVCWGAYPTASRCMAVIYRSNTRIKIETLGQTSGIELSIVDSKLNVKYTYSSADSEAMCLYQLHSFV